MWIEPNRKGNILFIYFFLKLIYFWKREKEREWVGEGQRERIPNRLHTPHWAWHGAQSHHCEIVPWAEVKTLTLNLLSHPDAAGKEMSSYSSWKKYSNLLFMFSHHLPNFHDTFSWVIILLIICWDFKNRISYTQNNVRLAVKFPEILYLDIIIFKTILCIISLMGTRKENLM